MNKVILMGRLVKDPEIRYSSGENAMAVARYILAVPRIKKTDKDDIVVAVINILVMVNGIKKNREDVITVDAYEV